MAAEDLGVHGGSVDAGRVHGGIVDQLAQGGESLRLALRQLGPLSRLRKIPGPSCGLRIPKRPAAIESYIH